MKITNPWVWFISASLLFLVSCGGSSTQLAAVNPAGSNSQQVIVTTDPVTGLPSIPRETPAATHTPSTTGGGELVVLGKDYWEWMLNGVVDGDALVLTAPAGEGDGGLAYGMYRFTGLSGKHPLSLNVEAVPAALGNQYFLAIANYTDGAWEWFGPIQVPEYSFDLSENFDRYVTELGNMYFLLVCYDGNGFTHHQTTLLFGDDEGDRLPGAPHELWASDGNYADKVRLEWSPGLGADHYEIWRRTDGEGAEWAKRADSATLDFNDFEVAPGVVYLYKVRAVNAAGCSGWSTMDPGHAGELPAGNYVIEGYIRHADESPVPGVQVRLLGLPEQIVTATTENGSYRFGDLPWGTFIVVPYAPDLAFSSGEIADCQYLRTQLGPEHPIAHLNFIAGDAELPTWRVWGFTYALDGESPTGFRPLGGAAVVIATEGLSVTAETNADGYFKAMELPVGNFTVTPGKDGFAFDPLAREIHVNHETVTEPRIFCATPESQGELPAAPIELTATKGTFADKVILHWGGGAGAGWYRIKRQRVDPLGEWTFLGECEVKEYADFAVDSGVWYHYKVQACNAFGQSDWSNIDFGYTSEAPPADCFIGGLITNGDSVPLNEIQVTLLGLETPQVAFTGAPNDAGRYAFTGLPHGLYVVVPFSQAWDFDPVYQVIDLRVNNDNHNVNFQGTPAASFHRLWGFIYNFQGEGGNGFQLLGGMTVTIHKDGSEDTWTVTTNEAGYYVQGELPLGTFILTPSHEGYSFDPAMHDATLNGEQKVAMLNFWGGPTI